MSAAEVIDLDELGQLDIIATGLRYLEAGVGPLVPLVGKDPSHYGANWWGRAINDPEQWVRVVAADSRYTGVGWAQGYGTVALDFDHPDEAGAELLAVARLGAKNPTRPGRGHRIFATEDAYGASTAGFPTRGWGEVRGKGGQIVIWGPHPEDPDAFYSYDASQAVPPAPPQLLEWLAGTGDHANAADLARLRDALGAVTERRRPRALAGIESRAAHVRAVLAGETTDHTVGLSRHDNLVDLCCWAAREALAGRFPLADAHRMLGVWWQTLDLPPRRAAVDLGCNEFTAAWQWALAQAEDDPERVARLRADDDLPPAAVAAPANVDPSTGEVLTSPRLVLPEEFWQARPMLSHIRTAALSRLVHPTGVLLVVLARVAALAPHTLRLPATVGSELGLSTLVMLAGHASAGKSGCAGTGRDLLVCHDPSRRDGIPPGSGEGLVELLYGTETTSDEKGRTVKQRVLKYHNVFAVVDEGTVLAELGDRKGSTLASTLRTIYTHGTLGQANASKDTHRIARGDQYVYGLVAGIQPELAGPMFTPEALAAGTTQRYLWAVLDGAELVDNPPDWPGPLDWKPPGSRVETSRLELHSAITAALIADRLAQARADQLEPIDAHGALRRLKVASLLAVLDERLAVTEEDWHLAGIVNDLSHAAMSHVRDRLGEVAAHREDSYRNRIAGRTLHVENAEETRALAACVRAVANKVHRTGECSRRDLQRAPASRSLRLVAFDDVLARAAAEGYIVDAGEDRWKPGRVKP